MYPLSSHDVDYQAIGSGQLEFRNRTIPFTVERCNGPRLYA
jgi:hypothetical protein